MKPGKQAPNNQQAGRRLHGRRVNNAHKEPAPSLVRTTEREATDRRSVPWGIEDSSGVAHVDAASMPAPPLTEIGRVSRMLGGGEDVLPQRETGDDLGALMLGKPAPQGSSTKVYTGREVVLRGLTTGTVLTAAPNAGSTSDSDSSAPRAGKAAEFIGTVTRSYFRGDPSTGGAFGVLAVRVGDKDVRVAGPGAGDVLEGEVIGVSGRWVQHPKYGMQVKSTRVQRTQQTGSRGPASAPAAGAAGAEGASTPGSVLGVVTPAAAVGFLSSGVLKGVGPATAQRIVEALGPAGSVELLMGDDWSALLAVKGIGQKSLERMRGGWDADGGSGRLALQLHGMGMPLDVAARASSRLGAAAAADILRGDPYDSVGRIAGMSLASADDVAARQLDGSLSLGKLNPARVQAAVRLALRACVASGHTGLPGATLVAQTITLLLSAGRRAPAPAPARDTGSSPAELGLPAWAGGADGGRDLASALAAHGLRAAPAQPAPAAATAAATAAAAPGATGPAPTAAYTAVRTAIQRMIDEGDVVWAPNPAPAGGPASAPALPVNPATGAVLRPAQGLAPGTPAPADQSAAGWWELNGTAFSPGAASTEDSLAVSLAVLAADLATPRPPGESAESASAADPAGTSGLSDAEGSASEGVADVGSDDDVARGGLSRDQARAVHAALTHRLAVLCGGPGTGKTFATRAVVRAWLRSGLRVSLACSTARAAHRLNEMLEPERREWSAELEAPASEHPGSCVWIDARDGASGADDVAGRVLTLVRELGFDPLTDMQVLSPMRRGPMGTSSLNERLRAELNPDGQNGGTAAGVAQPEAGGFAATLRPGDLVLQRSNDYDRGVINGDVGTVTSVRWQPAKRGGKGRGGYVVGVRFEAAGGGGAMGEGVDAEYFGGQAGKHLELAYAMTVHKAQGSEWPVVVLAMHTSHFPMLSRGLAYTALSRAKRLLVVVGTKQAMAIAAGSPTPDVAAGMPSWERSVPDGRLPDPEMASQPSRSVELEPFGSTEDVSVLGPLGVLGRAVRSPAREASKAWAAVTESGALRVFFAWEVTVMLVCFLTGSVAVAAYLGAQLPAASFPMGLTFELWPAAPPPRPRLLVRTAWRPLGIAAQQLSNASRLCVAVSSAVAVRAAAAGFELAETDTFACLWRAGIAQVTSPSVASAHEAARLAMVLNLSSLLADVADGLAATSVPGLHALVPTDGTVPMVEAVSTPPAAQPTPLLSHSIAAQPTAPVVVMLLLTCVPVILSWLLRGWFPADSVFAVPDTATRTHRVPTKSPTVSPAVSPSLPGALTGSSRVSHASHGVTPTLARRALALWIVMAIFLFVVVSVQALLNVIPPFDKNRVAFCMLVYGTNALAFTVVRMGGEHFLRDHVVLKETTIIAQQAVFTLLNAYLAFLSGLLWSFPQKYPLDVNDPLDEAAIVAHLNLVHGAGREVFAFLWLSTVTSQALRWASDIAGAALPEVIARRLPRPRTLYGSREHWGVSQLSLAFILGVAVLNPFVALLGGAVFAFTLFSRLVRNRFLVPGYRGVSVHYLPVVPRLLLVMPVIPLISFFVFLAPLGTGLLGGALASTGVWLVLLGGDALLTHHGVIPTIEGLAAKSRIPEVPPLPPPGLAQEPCGSALPTELL
ncbi:hypothetical protein FNF31_04761 [Cafeteria roenbergensis]|uniref:UvrD-like helicase C-terminal domain-containing protein n=1 Tax=Cafeteria roenbergensis TaxID=33653 RepID=A0A5A8D221_CAFRO|nr:hypothetical protein FNF31_04761 [Cafeteria roenbergensis]